jgi:hypothetical protein
MEQWLIDNGVSVGIFLIGGIFIYLKAQRLNERIMEDIEFLKKDVVDHHKAAMPHLGCPAHDATLVAIKTSIDEIRISLASMENRLFDLIRNGRRHE